MIDTDLAEFTRLAALAELADLPSSLLLFLQPTTQPHVRLLQAHHQFRFVHQVMHSVRNHKLAVNHQIANISAAVGNHISNQ